MLPERHTLFCLGVWYTHTHTWMLWFFLCACEHKGECACEHSYVCGWINDLQMSDYPNSTWRYVQSARAATKMHQHRLQSSTSQRMHQHAPTCTKIVTNYSPVNKNTNMHRHRLWLSTGQRVLRYLTLSPYHLNISEHQRSPQQWILSDKISVQLPVRNIQKSWSASRMVLTHQEGCVKAFYFFCCRSRVVLMNKGLRNDFVRKVQGLSTARTQKS